MKLRNKKTGEITNLFKIYDKYNKFEELIEDWEDYEEPKDKDFWFFDEEGIIRDTKEENWPEESVAAAKAIGNYFTTKEEAEKAVEKLKAWKRLKDKGFKLDAVVDTFFCLDIFIRGESYEAIKNDLKIVFGGEE